MTRLRRAERSTPGRPDSTRDHTGFGWTPDPQQDCCPQGPGFPRVRGWSRLRQLLAWRRADRARRVRASRFAHPYPRLHLDACETSPAPPHILLYGRRCVSVERRPSDSMIKTGGWDPEADARAPGFFLLHSARLCRRRGEGYQAPSHPPRVDAARRHEIVAASPSSADESGYRVGLTGAPLITQGRGRTCR